MVDGNLFKGVGMVVDDHVNSGDDLITEIVRFLEHDKRLFLVKYEELPIDIDPYCLSCLSFLLLDWELNTLIGDDGFPIENSNIKAENVRNNVDFIKQVVDKVVIPIFIFSNEDADYIKNTLSQNGIINNEEKSPIFILGKSGLFDKENKCIMFAKIKEWLMKTPSIYVTQKWKTTYLSAINEMSLDMRAVSPFWPNLLWNCYTNDGVNPSEEISSLINQNVLSRIKPFEFDEDVMSVNKTCDEKVLKDVLEKQCFMSNDKLGILSSTGDVYKWQQKYYLNIRPSCDCVGRDGKNKIYLIKGEKIKDKDIEEGLFNRKFGNFNEQSNFAIVGPIKGFFIRFKFKDIEIEDFEAKKEKRIGRLLPPFITRVTQKYSLYIHRQGLPRLPEEVISTVSPIADNNQDKIEEEKMVTLQEKIVDANTKLQQLSKENKELKVKLKKITNSQKCYRLYNCKVTIAPSLKRRKGKR